MNVLGASRGAMRDEEDGGLGELHAQKMTILHRRLQSRAPQPISYTYMGLGECLQPLP